MYPSKNDYLEQKICTKDNPLSEVLLLDSGSSCNTASNEDLVIDERPAKHPMELATNNGNSMMTREATIPNLGTAILTLAMLLTL